MDKEQQPQTEAEMMKMAAEAWDTPVEKNEAATETIAQNAEAKEDDAMNMEIQNESADLEKNSEAVKKALADVGGMEGLELTLQEMPEDKKTAMIKKLQEEYEKDMESRKYRIDITKMMAGAKLKEAVNPSEFYEDVRGPHDWAYEDSARKSNNEVDKIFRSLGDYSHAKTFTEDLRPTTGPAIKTALAFATLLGPASRLLSAGSYGVENIKERIGKNMAERRHEKELKKLENSEV